MKTFVSKKTIFIIAITCLFFLSLGGYFVSSVYAQKEDSIIITVDSEEYNLYDLPNGVEGKTYPVFDFSAVTENGLIVNDLRVYVYNPDSILLPIIDGRFSTDKTGDYRIVYVAEQDDLFESFETNVTVVSKEEYVVPTYTFSESILSNTYTGNAVYVYNGQVDGGIGNLKSQVEVFYNGDFECGDIKTYEINDGFYFIPMVSGQYVLKSVVEDIVSKIETGEKIITVVDDVKPNLQEPSISLIAHVGEKIVFPTVESILYYNGEVVYLPVKVFVNDTDITEDMCFTPELEGKYIVKYVCENPFSTLNKDETTVEKTYEVTVVKLQSEGSKPVYATKYMYLQNFTGAYDKDMRMFILSADGENDSAKMQFKTPIHADFLAIKLGVVGGNNNFEKISVTFTDSKNGSEKIELSFKQNVNGKIDAYLNGKFTIELDHSFAYENLSIIDIIYNPTTKTFIEDGGKKQIGVATESVDGGVFNGFSSNKAYISVDLDGVTGDSKIKLFEIAGQTITSHTYDNSTPFIVSGNFTRSAIVEYGSIAVMPRFEVFDLYDDKVDLRIEVVSPKTNAVSVVEETNNYKILVDEYGKYSVTYYATDSSGNETKLIAAIYVYDRTAPTITAVQLPTEVKLDDTLSLPNAVIKDNVTEECVSWIYVTRDDYQKYTVENNSYKFEKTGVYTIKYGAMDNDGNYTIVEYIIVCK